MSEQERIHALLKSGKISEQEASLLLEALSDVEEVEHSVAHVEHDADSFMPSPPSAAKPVNPKPAKPAPAVNEPAQDAANTSHHPDIPWVIVSLLAGDVNIEMDPAIKAPEVDGKVTLTKQGNNYLIGQKKEKIKDTKAEAENRDDFDKFIDGIGNFISDVVGGIRGDITIRVPASFGVDLNLKAGDLSIHGVTYVKGSVLSGDVDLDDIKGIDLNVGAGDLDAHLHLTNGQHRIKVAVGDVDIILHPDSDVAVSASVSIGDIDTNETSFKSSKRMMGGSVNGQIGNANASLDIQLSTGDLDINI